MEKNKTLEVRIEDHYGNTCLSDSLEEKNFQSYNFTRKPTNKVEIYEILDTGEKKLLSTSNLVLYQGREWLATKIFNLDNENLVTNKDEFISWFGLGSGGTSETDPFDPISPSNQDTALEDEIMISTTDASCADYRTSPFEEGFYKHPLTILIEQDPINDDAYIVVKLSISIGPSDANEKLMSEAGLFISESSDPGYAGPFHLYARATFPTIPKNESRDILFVWYVFV